MRALILADGDRPTRAALDAAWPGWSAGVDLVVAVDGGARLADELGLPIDRWVGDGDSLGAEGLESVRARGVVVDLAPIDKDESDAELGLLAAAAARATSITLLAGLGGPRPDHAQANIALLGHPAAAGRAFELLDPLARIRLLVADGRNGPSAVRLDLPGRIGDIVSLIPLATTTGVTTIGLRYPLEAATLAVGPARGISNIRTEARAGVTIRDGRLLVIEAPATLPS